LLPTTFFWIFWVGHSRAQVKTVHIVVVPVVVLGCTSHVSVFQVATFQENRPQVALFQENTFHVIIGSSNKDSKSTSCHVIMFDHVFTDGVNNQASKDV